MEVNAPQLITADQLRALYAISDAIGWSRKELTELTLVMFEMIPSCITTVQATALIEGLSARLHRFRRPS